MSQSRIFWDIVMEDGAPWDLLLPLMAIIGLLIAVGIYDSRRAPIGGRANAPWWTGPILVGIGSVGICLLLTGSLLGKLDEAWVYIAGGGIGTILLLRSLLSLSALIATLDRRIAVSHTEGPSDAPVWPMILLPLQAGAIFLIVRYFPWGWNETTRSGEGIGILILWPFMLIPWLLKIGLGAAAIGWIGTLMLPRALEFGSWLPGAITRRPLTAMLLAVWVVGLWYWFMEQPPILAPEAP